MLIKIIGAIIVFMIVRKACDAMGAVANHDKGNIEYGTEMEAIEA